MYPTHRPLTHIRRTLALGWCVLVWLFMPLSAFAYLDPGSGSFVVQVVVASFLGVAFTIKTFWQSIKFKIGQMFSKQ